MVCASRCQSLRRVGSAAAHPESLQSAHEHDGVFGAPNVLSGVIRTLGPPRGALALSYGHVVADVDCIGK